MLCALNQQKYNNGLMLAASLNSCLTHAITARSKQLVIRHLATNKLWSVRRKNYTLVFIRSIRTRSGSSINVSPQIAVNGPHVLFFTMSCIIFCKATETRLGYDNSPQRHLILEGNSSRFRWKSHYTKN